MKRTKPENWSGFVALLATIAVLAHAPAAAAQEGDVQDLIARGGESYRLHCSLCHGEDAAGGGSLARYLKTPPTDLTLIKHRNGGEFPFDVIYDIVDGREIPGHGSRTMPVWGPAFMGLTGETDKKVVREKIVELVYYLKSIQTPRLETSPKMGGGAS